MANCGLILGTTWSLEYLWVQRLLLASLEATSPAGVAQEIPETTGALFVLHPQTFTLALQPSWPGTTGRGSQDLLSTTWETTPPYSQEKLGFSSTQQPETPVSQWEDLKLWCRAIGHQTVKVTPTTIPRKRSCCFYSAKEPGFRVGKPLVSGLVAFSAFLSSSAGTQTQSLEHARSSVTFSSHISGFCGLFWILGFLILC